MWRLVSFPCHSYSSLLCLVWHYNHTHTWHMYLFPILELVENHPYRSEWFFTSFVVIGSTVVQNTTFVFILSSRSLWGGFPLFGCIPYLLMCRCPIFVFLDVSGFILVSFSLSPDHVFRRPCLMALRRLSVVVLNSATFKYCTSPSFMFVPECYLLQILIVESLGALTTFQFSISLCL